MEPSPAGLTRGSLADALLLHEGGWVYIVTNKCGGILYVGVTSNLPKRAWEQREGVVPGFTKRYGLKMLVYFEWHDEITLAIQREKNIKHRPRARKIDLIQSLNPDWKDPFNALG